ncbi:MAG: hypothetical protein Hyperionvirus1_123 [Hyperionvirus sp.]|uniref:Right handed beta helix domain-containing protein n=1 Tax=Hyperionvirus sp. TaxID=2487770 RepID=A0A3G5A7R0_9VIRU|nr:MAG: hypothetical protein Hyperionvirus1_123 [Hyperionvirus sp.]
MTNELEIRRFEALTKGKGTLEELKNKYISMYYPEINLLKKSLESKAVPETQNCICKKRLGKRKITQRDFRSGGYIIDRPGNYYFGEDIVFSAKNDNLVAITITASNVNLDLNSRSLQGVNNATIGIFVGNQNNITIRNGLITGFLIYGISVLPNSNFFILENLFFSLIGGFTSFVTIIAAVLLAGCSNITISKCKIYQLVNVSEDIPNLYGLFLFNCTEFYIDQTTIAFCQSSTGSTGLFLNLCQSGKINNCIVNRIQSQGSLISEQIQFFTIGINVLQCSDISIDGSNVSLLSVNGGIAWGINIELSLEPFASCTVNNSNISQIFCFNGIEGSIASGMRIFNFRTVNVQNTSVTAILANGGIGIGFSENASTVNFTNCHASHIQSTDKAIGFGYDTSRATDDEFSISLGTVWKECIADSCEIVNTPNKGITSGFDLFRHIGSTLKDSISQNNQYGLLNDGGVIIPPVLPNNSSKNIVQGNTFTNNTIGIFDNKGQTTYVNNTIN